MLIGSYLLLSSAPRTNSTHGIRGLTRYPFKRLFAITPVNLRWIKSGGRIRCLYGWYRIRCWRNIRCGTSQAHAIKSKLFRKRRSCIYNVSKSIPLPRGRAISPSRSSSLSMLAIWIGQLSTVGMEPFTNRQSADADWTRSDLGIYYYYMSLASVQIR